MMDGYITFFAMGWITWCFVFMFYRVSSGSRGWHNRNTPLAVAFGWILIPVLLLSLFGNRISEKLGAMRGYLIPLSIFIWLLPFYLCALYLGVDFESGESGFAFFFFDTAAFVYYY